MGDGEISREGVEVAGRERGRTPSSVAQRRKDRGAQREERNHGGTKGARSSSERREMLKDPKEVSAKDGRMG